MKRTLLAAACAALPSAGRLGAAVTADEAAKLKTTLTPLGAERGANKDGSIPAWDGGLTKAAGRLQERRPAARSVPGRQAAAVHQRQEHGRSTPTS